MPDMFNWKKWYHPLCYIYSQCCMIIYKEQVAEILMNVKSVGICLQVHGQHIPSTEASAYSI